MGIYGNAAVFAAQMCCKDSNLSPLTAWINAIANFTESYESRTKNCPRGAFLGLCEVGAVSGIPRGCYNKTKKNKNKDYALTALNLLKEGASSNQGKLWNMVIGSGEKHQNGQMDVVISLWEAALLR